MNTSYLRHLRTALLVVLFAGASQYALADNISVSLSAAGSTSSNYAGTTYKNTFDPTPANPYTFGASGVTGTYTGAFATTNQTPWGGSGATYVTTGGNSPAPGANYSFDLTLSKNVSYFGFMLDALDNGNQLLLFNGANQVGSVSNATLYSLFYGSATGSCSTSSTYCTVSGNNQAYGFVNITDTNGTFNRVEFVENPYAGQNFESDNHTIGGIAATPEPSSLTLLGTGLLGMAGIIKRRLS